MHQLCRSIFGKGLFAFALLSMVSCGGGGAGAGNNGGGNNEYPSVEQTIGPDGGMLELPGYATLNIPAGALPTNTKVRILTSNIEDHSLLSTLDDDGSTASPYVISVNLGQTVPKTHEITIDVVLPKDWSIRGIKTSDIQAFCDLAYEGENESLTPPYPMDNATSIISDGKLRITLPIEMFSRLNSNDGTMQANCMLDADPSNNYQSKLESNSIQFSSQAVSKTSSPFLWAPYRITSHFSEARNHPVLGIIRPHDGEDIVREDRTDSYATSKKIYPIAPGTVYKVTRQTDKNTGLLKGYGEYVILKHTKLFPPIYSLYAHMVTGSNNHLRAGQDVDIGTSLGTMGNTGTSSGAHLHVEIRPIKFKNNGTPREPLECEAINPKDLILLYEPMNGKWTFERMWTQGNTWGKEEFEFNLKQNGRNVQGTISQRWTREYGVSQYLSWNINDPLADDPQTRTLKIDTNPHDWNESGKHDFITEVHPIMALAKSDHFNNDWGISLKNQKFNFFEWWLTPQP